MDYFCRRSCIVSFCAFIGLTQTGWTTPQPTPTPANSGVRIFVAGHSFHQGIVPFLLPLIARNAGISNQVLVGTFSVGGSTVKQVWEESEKKSNVRTNLAAGLVDVLTLSPHRLLPDPGIDQFVDLGLAGNPHLRVTLQQSWIPFDNAAGLGTDPDPKTKAPIDWDGMTEARLLAISEPYFHELDQQVRAVNERLKKPVVFLVPTARALISLREKVRLGQVPGIKTQAALFRDRMGHPGTAVTLLNAYCHFAVIYRRSPVGLAVPGSLSEIPPADCAAINRVVQEIAWETVTHCRLSGVTAPDSPPQR